MAALTAICCALDRSCVVEEADRLAYVLALESTPYGAVTTLVSPAKSHQSDSRSAHEPARAALVQPGPAAAAARPWRSVKQPTVRTDRRKCAHRPSYVPRATGQTARTAVRYASVDSAT